MLIRRPSISPAPLLRPFPGRARRRGFTLVEVLVALAIFLAGLVAIVQLFPVSLRAQQEAAYKTTAVLLAQQKVEEIRRDRDRNAVAIANIEALVAPTAPLAFAEEPRLTYSFCGRSLLFPIDTAGSVEDDHDVARVIVRKSASIDPAQTVIYELRFDN